MLFQVLKVVSQWILISSPVIWNNLPYQDHSLKKKFYCAKFCAEHWVFSDGRTSLNDGYDLCPLEAYSLGRETDIMAMSHTKNISQCNGNV